MRVRHDPRANEDGYANALVPGLRASADAARLAQELALAMARLGALAAEPYGLYAEVASQPDEEEALWLAFLIAYVSPSGDGQDPFVGVRGARTPWRSAPVSPPPSTLLGPRSSHQPGAGARTLEAYHAWAGRSGSQLAALTGDASWSPERRFARIFERLALPGLSRGGRFDLLVSLGRLGRVGLRADALHFADGDGATLAAKRAFGIGDRLLLERRAAELAAAAQVPLEALDLALYNWGSPQARATMGMSGPVSDEEARGRAAQALGI